MIVGRGTAWLGEGVRGADGCPAAAAPQRRLAATASRRAAEARQDDLDPLALADRMRPGDVASICFCWQCAETKLRSLRVAGTRYHGVVRFG